MFGLFRKDPTVFHVTHVKAGSQWVLRILQQLAPHRVVQPKIRIGHFFDEPIRRGMIYPTLYLNHERFHSVTLPPDGRRFVIIRDLRDTLVSLYFSRKVSHPLITPQHVEYRRTLGELSIEEGLLHTLREGFDTIARVQQSWLDAGEPLFRYEDLLENDLELFDSLLIRHCGLRVSRRQLEQAVLANRFERLSGGRPRGQEDVTAHERKGIAGDWRNHFTPRLRREFDDRFGRLLEATGYTSPGDGWRAVCSPGVGLA
jgi:hypothetical protein